MIGQMEKILTRKAESVETKEKDEVENENLIELENKKEILPSFDLTAKEPKNIYYFEDCKLIFVKCSNITQYSNFKRGI